jgi:hypothetical protein
MLSFLESPLKALERPLTNCSISHIFGVNAGVIFRYLVALPTSRTDFPGFPHEQNCSPWASPRTEPWPSPTNRIAVPGLPHKQNCLYWASHEQNCFPWASPRTELLSLSLTTNRNLGSPGRAELLYLAFPTNRIACPGLPPRTELLYLIFPHAQNCFTRPPRNSKRKIIEVPGMLETRKEEELL